MVEKSDKSYRLTQYEVEEVLERSVSFQPPVRIELPISLSAKLEPLIDLKNIKIPPFNERDLKS
jgi:hypothetical protein